MSDHIKSENSELLIELSDWEQEAVSGGRRSSSRLELHDFFFQMTNIRSIANSGFNTSSGGFSALDQSGYMQSQITLSIGSLLISGGNRSRRGRGGSNINFLYSLLMALM